MLLRCRILSVVPQLLLFIGCGVSRQPAAPTRVFAAASMPVVRPTAVDDVVIPRRRWGCYELLPSRTTRCDPEGVCESAANRSGRNGRGATGPCRYVEIAWCFPVAIGEESPDRPSLQIGHPMGIICTDTMQKCEDLRGGFAPPIPVVASGRCVATRP